MLNKTKLLVLLIAAGALLALPATSVSEPQRCAKTPKVGFVVVGTLATFTPDNTATEAFEGAVSITVTEANGHATNSGDIADQDAGTEGVQVAGATYTVPASDPHKQVLEAFEGADNPSLGDAVTIIGKIPRTKAKCAAPETSLADRYGAVDVRQVVIVDSDADV